MLCHALLALAIPVCPLSSYATPFELAYLLRQSCVTWLFVSPRLLPAVQNAAKEVGLAKNRILILEGSEPGMKGFQDLIDDVVSRKAKPVDVRPVQKDTLAYMLFSSGTSGLPKAVMVSHGNLVFQLQQVEMTAAEAAKIALVSYDVGICTLLADSRRDYAA